MAENLLREWLFEQTQEILKQKPNLMVFPYRSGGAYFINIMDTDSGQNCTIDFV